MAHGNCHVRPRLSWDWDVRMWHVGTGEERGCLCSGLLVCDQRALRSCVLRVNSAPRRTLSLVHVRGISSVAETCKACEQLCARGAASLRVARDSLMLAARDDVASPTHLHWQAERAALTAEAQAELAALQTERLQVGPVAAAAVDTATEAVASDVAHAISWAGRGRSAGTVHSGVAAATPADVAVATLQVSYGSRS